MVRVRSIEKASSQKYSVKHEKRKENTTSRGNRGEALAAAYLESCGFQILMRNFRWHHKEIDLIALDGSILCFIEVKLRNHMKYGYGYEAVTRTKQMNIRTAASAFLYQAYPEGDFPVCRFDIVSIDAGRITLYKNAF